MKKLLFIAFLATAFLERTIFDLGPNIEVVTTVTLLVSFYLGRKQSLWLLLIILFLSDIILGNTNIYIFTWSGFLIPLVFVSSLFKKIKLHRIILGTSLGIGMNLFFYLWTNLGVWLLDSWGMYSKDANGLILCYLNALPFLKNQLLSTLLFVPVGFTLVEVTLKMLPKLFYNPGFKSKSLI